MAFTDFRTAALDALWDLLEAVTTVDPGNRVDPRTANGFRRSLMELTKPGDFPRLVLWDAGLTSTAYAADPSFGAEELDSPDGFSQPVAFGLSFELTLQAATSPDGPPLAVYNPLESAVFQAFVAGGPRLGLPFVISWRIDTASPPALVDLPGGQKGYEGRYRLPLSCMAESRDIITPTP